MMRAEWLTTQGDVADELERIGFKPNSAQRYDFNGDDLYARIVVLEKGIVVHFSQACTFDRWANSTNFVVKIDPEFHSADLEEAAAHARRICEAAVFDFNTYFHPIELT